MLREEKVLVVDDDEQRRHDLQVIFEFLGETVVSSNCGQWQKVAEAELVPRIGSMSNAYMLVVLGDCKLSSPLTERLAAVQSWNLDLPVILIGDVQREFDSLPTEQRQMVIAQLNLPLSYSSLMDTLHRAQRYGEVMQSRRQSTDSRPGHLFRSLVGTSRQIEGARKMMAQVADKEVTVLITGESGTGKEVVARNLHYNSDRRSAPFVPVNCGAIPAELLESELFGHEKGAFTGAINSRAGRFELAEGGTLFLDEIGDMPLNMQVKILRVLQERCFERVGSNKTQQTNVRIIAATHRNLEEMIEQGRFREDLFYRLNVFPIEMPSLRERREDIPLLLNELVSRLESEKRGSIRFNSGAIMSLCSHPWSGNVRELANLVERMAIMHPYGVIGVQDLPAKYRHLDTEEDLDIYFPEPEAASGPQFVGLGDTALIPDEGIDLKEYLTGLERSLIQQALDDAGGVVARAASRLAIRRTTLVEKMRKYGLQRN